MGPRLASRALLLSSLVLVSRAAVALDPAVPVRSLLVDRWSTSDGLPHDTASSILQTRDGYVRVTTEEGLVRFDGVRFEVFDVSGTPDLPSNVLWKLHEEKDGLLDDLAGSILEDGGGNFWIGCNKGVSWVRVKELDDFADGRIPSVRSLSYGTADGMKSAECNGGFQPTACRTSDGRLWFPTAKGVAVADPRKLYDNPLAPPVLVEAVLVHGIAADPGRTVEVLDRDRTLEIRFTALSFVAPRSLRFRFKMEGLDSDWVDAGARRTAYYRHLPPGRYTFRVTGCNRDGVWAGTGAASSGSSGPTSRRCPASWATSSASPARDARS